MSIEPIPEFDADFRMVFVSGFYTVYVPGLGISATDSDSDKATDKLVRQLRQYAYWWNHSDYPTSEHPERSAALAAQVDGLTDEEIVEWINREPDPSRTFLLVPAASTYQFTGFEVFLDDNGAFVILAPDLGLLSGEQTLAETVADMTHAAIDYADEWVARPELRTARGHISNEDVVATIRSMSWPEVYEWVIGEIRQDDAAQGIATPSGSEAAQRYLLNPTSPPAVRYAGNESLNLTEAPDPDSPPDRSPHFR